MSTQLEDVAPAAGAVAIPSPAWSTPGAAAAAVATANTLTWETLGSLVHEILWGTPPTLVVALICGAVAALWSCWALLKRNGWAYRRWAFLFVLLICANMAIRGQFTVEVGHKQCAHKCAMWWRDVARGGCKNYAVPTVFNPTTGKQDACQCASVAPELMGPLDEAGLDKSIRCGVFNSFVDCNCDEATCAEAGVPVSRCRDWYADTLCNQCDCPNAARINDQGRNTLAGLLNVRSCNGTALKGQGVFSVLWADADSFQLIALVEHATLAYLRALVTTLEQRDTLPQAFFAGFSVGVLIMAWVFVIDVTVHLPEWFNEVMQKAAGGGGAARAAAAPPRAKRLHDHRE